MSKTTPLKKYEAIVMGVSAGDLAALTAILPHLSDKIGLPVLIVQHISSDSDDFLATHFNRICSLSVKEAEDKETLVNGTIYFAPANYHLMVEQDKTIAQSPESAEVDIMPLSAINQAGIDKILDLNEIAPYINLITVKET